MDEWQVLEEMANREAFTSLLTHKDQMEFSEWKHLRSIAKMVQSVLPKVEVDEGVLIEHLLRFKCNNFMWHDSQIFAVAEATFPVGSLFNHSCRPNASLFYIGRRQVIRAIRDLREGEEVCLTYVDVMNTRENRQYELQQKYSFVCQCERCQDLDGLDQRLVFLEEGKENDVETKVKIKTKAETKPEIKEEGKKEVVAKGEHNSVDQQGSNPSHQPIGPNSPRGKVDEAWLEQQFKNYPLSLHDFVHLATPSPITTTTTTTTTMTLPSTDPMETKSLNIENSHLDTTFLDVLNALNQLKLSSTPSTLTTHSTALLQPSCFESFSLINYAFTIGQALLPVINQSDDEFDAVHKALVKRLNPLNLNIFTKVCQYTYTCIDKKANEPAALAALFVLMSYLVFLGRAHPLTGLQWLTVGKLVWNIGDQYRDEALYFIQQARISILISEGNSDILEEIDDLLKQIS